MMFMLTINLNKSNMEHKIITKTKSININFVTINSTRIQIKNNNQVNTYSIKITIKSTRIVSKQKSSQHV